MKLWTTGRTRLPSSNSTWTRLYSRQRPRYCRRPNSLQWASSFRIIASTRLTTRRLWRRTMKAMPIPQYTASTGIIIVRRRDLNTRSGGALHTKGNILRLRSLKRKLLSLLHSRTAYKGTKRKTNKWSLLRFSMTTSLRSALRWTASKTRSTTSWIW